MMAAYAILLSKCNRADETQGRQLAVHRFLKILLSCPYNECMKRALVYMPSIDVCASMHPQVTSNATCVRL